MFVAGVRRANAQGFGDLSAPAAPLFGILDYGFVGHDYFRRFGQPQ